MSNQDSLRKQIIESMVEYGKQRSPWIHSWDEVFDDAIMPVLDAAMKAGELLLHRATTPMKPVDQGIVEWLEGCSTSISDLRSREHTVSKRELLDAFYGLQDNLTRALADARSLKPKEPTSDAMWGALSGNSLPLKG